MKTILKNTWTILTAAEKKTFSWLVLFDIIISLLDILSLAILVWIVQFYIQPGDSLQSMTIPGWLGSRDSIRLIAIFFILFGAKNIVGYLITKANHQFNSRVAVRISCNTLSKYQHAGFNEFINIDSSKQIRKICLQPFEFCQYILSGIQQFITQSSLISLAIVAILLFNARLFLLLLIILLPPVILVFYLVKKRMAAARKNIQVQNERSYQYVLDALKGYVESNIYGRHDFFLSRFINAREKFSNSLFESVTIQSMPGRVIEIFAILGLFLLIIIARWSGNADSTSLLTIGAFLAAAYKIIPGIVKITNISGQIRAYEFSTADLMPDDVTTKTTINAAVAPIHSIRLKDIVLNYGTQPVLVNFNFRVCRGEFIGISGASGKGKTTLFNIILGFLEASSGEVLFNDKAITKDSIRNYWPAFSYIRQQAFFIHDTLRRNITLEENSHDETRLQNAIRISGLQSLIMQSPEGADKMIMENGKNISGGQQQRIAIARALYKKADLILLDEPFNELDEDSELSLLKHFQELAQEGKLILLITHNKNSLSYCTKTISLDEQV